jgi:urea carboxylase-associated protein 1
MNKSPRIDDTVPARSPWSCILHKGETLRIIDIEGQQAVDALFYDAEHPEERYSAQDTVMAQASPYIGQGSRLLSNEGNLMCTVVEDSCGRHDTSAGACSCESNTVRFGHETRYMHACRENFVLEIGKYGLTKRDLVSNINFFMNVPILPSGEIAIDDGISAPGAYIDLEAARDIIVVLSNCPQVNNPCNGFNPTPIRCIVR